MTIKDIKTLQEMGFSLEEIKKEYFTETISGNAEESGKTEESKGTDIEADKTEEPEVKKNIGTSGSTDSLDSLKSEITDIKNMIYNKYSREDQEQNKARTDDLLSAMNRIINKEGN